MLSSVEHEQSFITASHGLTIGDMLSPKLLDGIVWHCIFITVDSV